MNRQPHSATIFLLVGCGVVKNPRGFSPGEDVNWLSRWSNIFLGLFLAGKLATAIVQAMPIRLGASHFLK